MPYKDPAKAREHRRQYYAANRERILAANKNWVAANQERFRAYHRAYGAEWRKNNRERALAYTRAWVSRNRQYNLDRAMAWFAANPEAYRAAWARNRKKRNGAEGRFTGKDIRRILVAQGERCLYCHARLSEGYEIDHVVPLSKGGTHWPSNIALACRPCNRSKHARLDWSPGCRLTA